MFRFTHNEDVADEWHIEGSADIAHHLHWCIIVVGGPGMTGCHAIDIDIRGHMIQIIYSHLRLNETFSQKPGKKILSLVFPKSLSVYSEVTFFLFQLLFYVINLEIWNDMQSWEDAGEICHPNLDMCFNAERNDECMMSCALNIYCRHDLGVCLFYFYTPHSTTPQL